ncbi:disease resistance protein RUN1-like [Lactuca sativa]|uniref:disease resistance protein RUN1-like n=1 Tax=Lactuca sativa TaxID=4236 RepID=UPI000CD7FB94|nr:disease resistance protein RUN1-like [Lactuca sativa]
MVELHEISEGSSSSSSTHGRAYDVFISFRGVDTRNSFINHLYNALMHANITTFLDDEEIETGEDLKPELESAIKSSKASAIVLSKNYATSTWCLDELVLILEQRRTSKHIVIPIFYHVEPTHVRKQQSSFGDAMAKHRQKMEAETDENKRSQWAQKMDRWKKALIEVADLKGKDANGRCLLSYRRNNELMMHQLVQEMERFLICEESPDKPGERSRLWCHEETFKVLKQKKATENVLGLTLDMRMLVKEKLHGSLELKTDALSKMDRLMLLQLNYVQITDSYKNFPEELRWLCMHGFPLKFIPSDLPMENLVVLDLSHSNIESFGICCSYPQRLHRRLTQWIGSFSKDKWLLGSLKILNLSSCEQLRSLVGFDHLPVLEKLILRGCIGLFDVCESIEQCVELFSLI